MHESMQYTYKCTHARMHACTHACSHAQEIALTLRTFCVVFVTGLLHNIPVQVERIESLLRECVIETSVGGREQAYKDLQLVLVQYAEHSKRAHAMGVPQT